MDSFLRTLHGIIFVNRETQKWELWAYHFYTKIGNNYKASYNFNRILSYDDYTALLNEINLLGKAFNKTNILNIQSLNLFEKSERRSFNSVTGEIGEEGTGSISMTIINLEQVNTTDIYFYNPYGALNPNLRRVYCYDQYGTYMRGGFPYDEETSDNYVRHFVIPLNASKLVAQYVHNECAYATRIETCVPYGLTERELNIRNSDYYRLGKSLDSVSIDISNLFGEMKEEVFLKAGNSYRVTSDAAAPYRYLDVHGNSVNINLGQVFIPQYDAYYLLSDFINMRDQTGNITIEYVHNEIDLTDDDTIKGLTYSKTGKLPFIICANAQAGTIDGNGNVTYSEDGTQYVSEFIPIIPTPMIYVTSYIINLYFYDVNKNYIGHGTTIAANSAYKSPEGAYYMVCRRPGPGPIGFGYVSTEEEYKALGATTIRQLSYGDKTRFSLPNTRLRNKSVYVIGDSEAARLVSYFNDGNHFDSLMFCSLSSFGGHSDDFVGSNIGHDTGGQNRHLESLKGAKVIVQAGTNGDDTPRLRAYIVELVKRLREYGASEIWGMSLCVGHMRTFDELKTNGKYQMQKLVFGSHFIDHMAAVFQMGLYYNLYHPNAFTQPEVGSNVDIYFNTIRPFIDFTSNPIFGEGLDFYMQYYDDKYDIYTVVSIDEENNKITATLKTNSSDIAPGSTAGQYEEEVSSPVYTGTKITKGFIYNENDKNNIAQGKLPYNIYPDHSVHYGLILTAVMKELLYTAGALEYEDETAVTYLNH